MKKKRYTNPTRLIKAKKGWKYCTRKDFKNEFSYYSLSRDGPIYYQTDSSRSRIKKFLKKQSNSKIRRDKLAYRNGEYKKVFDLPRLLD